jgi:hypothetical protein
MATEAIKSAWVTNATATPVVLTSTALAAGVLHEANGTVTPVLSAPDVGSTYRFCRVPSNARISQVMLTCLAFGAGAVDVGVYQTAENGGAVVDADLFASAVSIASARTNFDVTYESAEYTTAESEQPLWQVLGLSADSNREYDIVATVTTQLGTCVPLNCKVRYAA